MKKSLTL